jgi:MFS family permease
MNRYYSLPPDKAGLAAAGFILIGGLGMVLCGIVTDRFSRSIPARKWIMAIVYSILSAVMLLAAFRVNPGPIQLGLIGAGMLLVAGTAGPAGAMVANLTHPSIHSAAFATLTLANNFLGLAPGPFVTGVLADRLGLLGAMQIIPCVALAAAIAFAIGRIWYAKDLMRLADARY